MPHWEWSSPVRKSGTLLLTPIPNEIYLEIFKYLRPLDPQAWISSCTRKYYCGIALVCRFFSATMLPWIFENLTFGGIGRSKNASASSTSKFCRSVLNGDPTTLLLAKHVKRCAFKDWGITTAGNWANAQIMSLYCDAMAFMPNLCEVDLKEAPITKFFLKKCPKLSALRKLSLQKGGMDEDIPDKYLRRFSSLQLEDLDIGEYQHTFSVAALLPYVNPERLRHFKAKQCCFITKIPQDTAFHSLEDLEIHNIQDVHAFRAVLENAPVLKRLHIASIRLSAFMQSFEPTVLPMLTDLRAPCYISSNLVPGRPISSLAISYLSEGFLDMPMVLRDAITFSKSTQPIRRMCIPLHFYKSGPFWEHFPELRILHLDVAADQSNYFSIELSNSATINELVDEIVQAWPKHPDLQELHLELPHYYWKTQTAFGFLIQKSTFGTLSSAFPSLHRFEVNDKEYVRGRHGWKLEF